VNVLCLGLLAERYLPQSGRWKWFGPVTQTAWGLFTAVGLALLCQRAWTIDIPEREFYFQCHLRYTRAFMATDDVTVFDGKPKTQIPFYEGDPYAPVPKHQGDELAKLLRHTQIREVLPTIVRDPLKVLPASATNQSFVPRGFSLGRNEPLTERSWGSYTGQGAAATGRFESARIRRSRLPYLEISVAGDLGASGLSLELVELATDKRTAVKPPEAAGQKWVNCYVKAPSGDFKIVAADESTSAWFAFKEPREVSRGTMWSIWLMKAGPWLFFAGIALFLCNCGVCMSGRKPSSGLNNAPKRE